MGVVAAALVPAARSRSSEPNHTRARAYFVADPRAATLVPWTYFDAGLGTKTTTSDPAGATTPGVVRPSHAPDGRFAYELTVTPSSHASEARGSDAVWLWNDARRYDGFGNANATTWYHERLYFPAGKYAPTTGNWNLVIEHHNDGGGKAVACSREDANLAIGVTTDFPVASGVVGRHPLLRLRVMGGPSCSPRQTWFTLGRLKLGHWYDLRYQVRWHAVNGRVNVWVDNRRLVTYAGPTLYSRPSGATSYTYLELVNYRLHAPWSSTVYFGAVKIGPTRRSVR
jgi:hypothetical protein